MAGTQTDEHVSLKLVVNAETNKVYFAEAGKDFVDVLFSFMTLPLGTIARLIDKDSKMGPITLGSLNSLYHSVAHLDTQYKEMLLQPSNSAEDFCNTLKLNIDDTEPKKYFMCTAACYRSLLNDYCNTLRNCNCGRLLTHEVFLKHFSNGFVKDGTFIITDDLIVMPNSVDYATFSLFQNLGIRNPSSVKEMTINVTKEKVLDLLKCSLLSKSCLTDLLLEKKPTFQSSTFLSSRIENDSGIKFKLKLVIRKSNGKILYAQGEKDFADMLLSFLTFPMGGVVGKLGGNSSVGSIDGLYKSIADINENVYFMSKPAKNRLVDPCLLPHFKLSIKILPIPHPSIFRYYRYYEFINGICRVMILKDGEHANSDGELPEIELLYPETPIAKAEGFVKGPAMYVATDNLVVAPFSPISALNFLNRLSIPFNDLKEKDVTIGLKECLNILKASLTTTSALTNGLRHLLTEVKEEK
ncbi:uncharacterized protein LOC114163606 [Vigna unguiculata]|uniref:uncharacterized protein LOC114163606 n=1 Tax=Vigna unguiculata TaxID=3917 RepID=UPI001015F880|nr:uncharacterized protein LOC114163606 [Vigna unguiculata]